MLFKHACNQLYYNNVNSFFIFNKYSLTLKMKDKQIKRIEVAIRMRPLLHLFEDQQAWSINSSTKKISSAPSNTLQPLKNITNLSDFSMINNSNTLKKRNSIQNNNIYEFSCDHAFSPSSQNIQVYNECCSQIVQSFCAKSNRTNGTIFMYGQTTSGKTYTMLGDKNVEGLISFSLQNIFHKIQKCQKQQISISYFEIYNQQINDLLNPGSTNLRLIDDAVQGAKEYIIGNYEDALKLLQYGEEQRAYRQKKYHDHSSRSHTIFQIKRLEETEKNSTQVKTILNLVDLAGSQRLTDEEGNEETGYINKSLFVLSTVIHRLATTKKNTAHIPFRDSKLTRLLAPSLMGSSRTLVICTISPASLNFYQTLSTLRFAACSKKVELKPNQSQYESNKENKQNKDSLKKLQEQNSELKAQLQKLKKSEQENYLEEKSNKIMAAMRKENLGNYKQWQNKMGMLCVEYKKNIETLQKQYTKAMINAIAQESNLNRSSLMRILSSYIQQ